jgi:hypothetical protein
MSTTRARSLRILTIGLIAAALTATAVLAGCAKSDPPEPASAARDFDSFPDYQLGLVHAATQQAAAACMAAAGHPQLAGIDPTLPPADSNHLRVSEASFGPPNEEHANRLGFGLDKPAEPPFVISSDPKFDRALEDCTARAWEQLGRNAKQTYSDYVALGETMNADYTHRMTSEPRSAVHERFLDCLSDNGFPVPDRAAFLRDQTPSHFGIRFGTLEPTMTTWKPRRVPGTVEVSPPVPGRRYLPTRDESRLAVAFVRCNQSTGRTSQLLALARRIQAEVARENATTIAQLDRQLIALIARATALLGIQG